MWLVIGIVVICYLWGVEDITVKSAEQIKSQTGDSLFGSCTFSHLSRLKCLFHVCTLVPHTVDWISLFYMEPVCPGDKHGVCITIVRLFPFLS